jgi:KDO2-lipid IV(A) lauroyltransferase
LPDAIANDLLPKGLRRDWPVERLPVSGTREGLGARLEFLAMRLAIAGVDALPAGLRERVIGALARLGRRFDAGHSDAAREFLRTALGEMPPGELEERVLDAWRHLLRVAISSGVLDRHVDPTRMREHTQVDLSPESAEIFASRRGCIVITGHIGDWEAGSAVLPWIGCDPLYVIAKPPRNNYMAEHLQRLREMRGIRVLPRRGAMKHAKTILAAGGTIAMLLDQRARTRPVFAPFFGRMARCDRSAGVLLRRLRAPAVIGACWSTGPWRWHVRLEEVLHPADVAKCSYEEVATRINASLEKLILEKPEQYFWLHDRYRGADEASRARESRETAETADAGE